MSLHEIVLLLYYRGHISIPDLLEFRSSCHEYKEAVYKMDIGYTIFRTKPKASRQVVSRINPTIQVHYSVWDLTRVDWLFEAMASRKLVCRVDPSLVPELSSHRTLLVEISDLVIVFAFPALENLLRLGCKALQKADRALATLAQTKFKVLSQHLWIEIYSCLRDHVGNRARTCRPGVDWIVTICDVNQI